MSKLFKCLLSVCISIALVLTAVPLTAIAEESVSPTQTEVETVLPDDTTEENREEEPYIVAELVDKRESNVKHFRMSDGTITAAYYSQPVHFEDENGNLTDIDNTLSSTTDDSDDAFGNSANDFSVKFMKKSNKNKLYTITKGSDKIKVAIEGVSKVNVQITEPESTLDIDSPYKLENIGSKAVYTDIFENADLEYTVVSNNIKENLVLKSAVDFTSVIYNYKIGNKLKAVVVNEKTVDIVNRESGELIFSISAPTMWDSTGNYSDDLTLEIIEETNTTVKIKLSWDSEFLETAVYPVTIDPVTSYETDPLDIHDTHIIASLPEENYDGVEHIRVRNNGYALVKFPTPELSSGDKIVKAQLFLRPLAQGGTFSDPLYSNENSYNPPLYITTHKILRDWDEKLIKYGNCDPENGFYDDTAYSYRIVDGDDSVYTWDITRLATEWTDGGVANNGILLKYDAPPADGSMFDTFFCSTNGKDYPAEVWPQILYQYINTTGIEDYYSYHTQDLGYAGTAYTNDLTGNLTIINPVVSTGGSLMPITVSLVYNTNNVISAGTSALTHFGNGWKLNWSQKLDRTIEEDLGITIAKYIDADGTEHYFNFNDSTGVFTDEIDPKRKIIWISSSIYRMNDSNGEYKLFKRYGTTKEWYLYEIGDAYGNYIRLELNSSDYDKIDRIYSSTGNEVNLTYDSNGVLTQIKYYDGATEKIVALGYENHLKTTNNSLRTVTFADNSVVNYHYHTTVSYLSVVNDIDGMRMSYNYFFNNPVRVRTVTQTNAAFVIGQQMTVTYQTDSTTFTDVTNNRKYLYTFSNLGTLTSVVDITDNDGNGYGQYYEYNNGDSTTTTGKGNLTFMSKTQKSTVNLIQNHSYEYVGYKPYFQAWSETTGTSTGAVSTLKSNIGAKSYRLYRHEESNSSRVLGYIRVSLTSGITYTLSAYVNTAEMISKGQGASLYICSENQIIESEFLTDAKDEWRRISVTFTSTATENVSVCLSLMGATGVVYFDNIQLEVGGLSDYNILENAGFEYEQIPEISDWIPKSGYTASTDTKISGSLSGKLSGNITKYPNYYQNISVTDGKSGDTYVGSAFAKAQSVPAEGLQFSILISFLKNGETINQTVKTFNSHTTEWQKIAISSKATGDYDTVRFWLLYYSNCNTAYFDNAQLIKDTFGNTYTYDSNNNLISTIDLRNKEDYTFKYDGNNQLISQTSVSGGRVFYTYNSSIKQRLENVTSGGVTTAYTYDSKGNALSSTTYGSEFIEGKYYYIRNAHYSKYLEVVDSGTTNGTNVIVGDFKKSSAQRWKFTKNSDGTYSISPECATNMLLSVEPATLYNYANAALYASGSSNYQKFQLNKYNSNIYFLDLAANAGYSLDVGSASAYFFTTHHSDFQKFVLIPAENSQSAENPVITSSATYSDNGEYTMSTTDSRGETTDYTYYDRGMLNTTTAPNETVTTYTYNDSELLTKVAAGLDTDSADVDYTYDTAKRLSTITSPSDTVYSFTYDSFARTDTIKVGSTTLSDYGYDSKGNLEAMLYGNGTTLKYSYDSLNRKTGVSFNDTLTYSFIYDGQSRFSEILDIFNNQKYKFTYDILDRLTGERLINTLTNTPIAELSIRYDDTKNRVSGYNVNIEGNTKSIDYVYGENSLAPDIITGIKQNDTRILTYGYDGLNRQTTRTIATTTPYVTNYTYLQGADDSNTTTLLETLKNGDDTLKYTYDNMGNIETISKNNETLETYDYDYLNQLTSVINSDGTYLYTYDDGGNILSVTLTPPNSEVITPVKTYTYSTGEWKDLLTFFNEQPITYDNIGNPLEYYDGSVFTWSQGRKLTGITKGEDSISYTYNADGLRTSKTVNGTTTDYYWLNGILQGQKTGSEYILFLHDENGTAYGFLINNGTTEAYYYYLFNAQGDVIGILDNSGIKVVEYTYDVWGKLISTTGTLASTIGQTNPIRYRGYYYDSETGFYYLQSRYYDAEIGRFVNADGLLATGQGILGYNMFAYCNNNPVMFADPNGKSIIVAIGIGLVALGMTLGLSGCSNKKSTSSTTSKSSSKKPANAPTKPSPPDLTDDQKVLIATIAAEATVTANGTPVSSAGRQAMANVALNRVGSREWSKYQTVAEICQYTGFDGYGDENYWACMNYLNSRDGSNSTYEAIIWDVMSAYESDITGGCQLYYTPAAMQPAGSQPNWNFSILNEVYIPGVDPYYEGRFYRY